MRADQAGLKLTHALYSTALQCTLLHCNALFCTALYCTLLHCSALYCTALHSTLLYCTTLNCTILHCTELYCTAVYCTTLNCNVLHYTVCSVQGVSDTVIMSRCVVTCSQSGAILTGRPGGSETETAIFQLTAVLSVTLRLHS